MGADTDLARSGDVDRILDHGTPGLRYFELYLPLLQEAMPGDGPGYLELCARYDMQRGMNLTALGTVADALRRALATADAEWELQNAQARTLPSIWHGAAAAAATDLMRGLLVRVNEDRVASRTALAALDAALPALKLIIAGKANAVRAIWDRTAGTIDGKHAGQVHDIVRAAATYAADGGAARPSDGDHRIDRVAALFPGVARDALPKSCFDWVHGPFRTDVTEKVGVFERACASCHFGVEGLYKVIIDALAQVSDEPYPKAGTRGDSSRRTGHAPPARAGEQSDSLFENTGPQAGSALSGLVQQSVAGMIQQGVPDVGAAVRQGVLGGGEAVRQGVAGVAEVMQQGVQGAGQAVQQAIAGVAGAIQQGVAGGGGVGEMIQQGVMDAGAAVQQGAAGAAEVIRQSAGGAGELVQQGVSDMGEASRPGGVGSAEVIQPGAEGPTSAGAGAERQGVDGTPPSADRAGLGNSIGTLRHHLDAAAQAIQQGVGDAAERIAHLVQPGDGLRAEFEAGRGRLAVETEADGGVRLAVSEDGGETRAYSLRLGEYAIPVVAEEQTPAEPAAESSGEAHSDPPQPGVAPVEAPEPQADTDTPPAPAEPPRNIEGAPANTPDKLELTPQHEPERGNEPDPPPDIGARLAEAGPL
ncbi:hypothetical protein NDR87_19315 [Nocardia sp. CDC159]|uniref:Uncharacterized protein n=1 Tax=Nocardia pulmonis TaxID=2951408 RepID=A0A9X2EDC7_9NOCA|nr:MULTISPECIES: hypothetical protein [Nocardia]MCM6776158.1 hypothetical protein [Nocardia pulmonis]MCM6788515.1 hypothetical protein [Nocardia sp. CDC159]